MTTFSNIPPSANAAQPGAQQGATSMAAAWQLSAHQLDAARKVLQHAQRSMAGPRSAGSTQAAPSQQ